MSDKLKKRFSSFQKAYELFKEALSEFEHDKIKNSNRITLVHTFEMCAELSWKILKDKLFTLGVENLISPKEIINAAFAKGLIDEGQSWQDMILARNLTSHIYNEETALKILFQIENVYSGLLYDFKINFESGLE